MSTYIEYGPGVSPQTYEQRLREERERITGHDWHPPTIPDVAEGVTPAEAMRRVAEAGGAK